MGERISVGAVELLDAVAAHGSLTAAAAALGIAQPSVSAGLRRLERRTGLTLVSRSATGTRLTAAGRTVLDRGRALLAASDALEREIVALRQGERVRVAASLSIAEYLVPLWLSGRSPEAAAVELTVANSREVMAEVLDGRADLGFVEGPRVADGLRQRVVGDDELLVVVAPDHPWARLRTPLDPATLAAGPLAVREEGSGTREVLEEALLAAGTALGRAVHQLGSTSAVKTMVRTGRIAAVLSQLTVADEIARGALVAVPTAVDLRRRLRMVWSSGREPSAAARQLAADVVSATSR
ncbi:LysR family transcriptional regulator [Cellulomonas taurus]|uniref:LysR family transcriptional regulator n=1 Tax=Cellulomonas taurus TaxID=2729175 RepID=UPI00145E3530|nr:LysR family transcriptional regulator [Cellulomonas taurus]